MVFCAKSRCIRRKYLHFAVFIIGSMQASTNGEMSKRELDDSEKESRARALRMLARIIARAHLVNTGSRVSGIDIQGDPDFPKVDSLQDGEQD
jgi:hypothetical protein